MSISSSLRTSSRTSSRSSSPSLFNNEALIKEMAEPKQYTINAISINQDHSRVSLACNDAFRSYSLPDFQLVCVFRLFLQYKNISTVFKVDLAVFVQFKNVFDLFHRCFESDFG